MRTTRAIMVALALAALLSACGGSDEPIAEEPKPANPDCSVNFRACAL